MSPFNLRKQFFNDSYLNILNTASDVDPKDGVVRRYVFNIIVTVTVLFLFFSKEDVERCKQKDLLEEMLVEMTGEFPELSRVFVNERDMYLAHMLRTTAVPIKDPHSSQGCLVLWKFFD